MRKVSQLLTDRISVSFLTRETFLQMLQIFPDFYLFP